MGRLTVTTANGDTDGDGDFDELYTFEVAPSRSGTSRSELVYDSGDDLEQITASQLPQAFNSDNSENNSFDSRSDDKGPEPKALQPGSNDRTYAFIGLERIGGVLTYDVTDPTILSSSSTSITVTSALSLIQQQRPPVNRMHGEKRVTSVQRV